MPDPLEVRLGSQASGGFGSFGKCGLVGSFPKPPGPVPHSERLYSESSRSADRCDAKLPRWFCCGRGAERDDGRRSRRCFLYAGGDCFLLAPASTYALRDTPRTRARSYCEATPKNRSNVIHPRQSEARRYSRLLARRGIEASVAQPAS